MALLTALDISEEAAVWSGLGFDVVSDVAWVSGVGHHLGGAGAAIASWSLFGVELPPGPCAVDGLPTVVVDAVPDGLDAAHPNGVTELDHLVVSTPDLDRTFEALDAIGLQLLRVREAPTVRQGFYRLGPVILEVVGSPSATGDGAATFFGLAWTCADLDATASWLGPRLRPAKDAVQRGRRIATLDRGAGSRVSMAFMSSAPRQ